MGKPNETVRSAIAGDRQYNTGNTSAVSQLKSKSKSGKIKSTGVVHKYIRSDLPSDSEDSSADYMRLRRYTFRFNAESRSHPLEGRKDHVRGRLRPYITRFNGYSRFYPLEGRVDRRFGSNPTMVSDLALNPAPVPVTPVPGPVDSVSSSTASDNLAPVPGPVDYASVPGTSFTVADNLAPVPGPVDYTPVSPVLAPVPGPVNFASVTGSVSPVMHQFDYGDLSVSERLRVDRILSDKETDKVLGMDGEIVYNVALFQTINQMLSEHIINTYMKICDERIRNNKVAFGTTQFYRWSKRNPGVEKQKLLEELGMIGKELIFVPIYNFLRWVLIVINFKTETFEYYDPMVDSEWKKQASRYTDKIKKQFKSTSLEYVMDWKIKNMCKSSTLRRFNDSGIVICQWIRLLAQDKQIEQFGKGNIALFRTYMVLDLVAFTKEYVKQ
jgi:hypothetical protein